MNIKNITKAFIGLFIVIGIPACGYAITKTGGGGWDGLVPGLFGLVSLAASGALAALIWMLDRHLEYEKKKRKELFSAGASGLLVEDRFEEREGYRKLRRAFVIIIVVRAIITLSPLRQFWTYELSALVHAILLAATYLIVEGGIYAFLFYNLLKGKTWARVILLMVIPLSLLYSMATFFPVALNVLYMIPSLILFYGLYYAIHVVGEDTDVKAYLSLHDGK